MIVPEDSSTSFVPPSVRYDEFGALRNLVRKEAALSAHYSCRWLSRSSMTLTYRSSVSESHVFARNPAIIADLNPMHTYGIMKTLQTGPLPANELPARLPGADLTDGVGADSGKEAHPSSLSSAETWRIRLPMAQQCRRYSSQEGDRLGNSDRFDCQVIPLGSFESVYDAFW